jgi:hypothetical protein
MRTTICFGRRFVYPIAVLAVLCAIPRARAVDALLLQDAYTDSTSNKTTTNFGTSGDLRVFKSSTVAMRTFLKFNLATLPAGTAAADIKQARLRLWANSSSTILGSITLTPVTSTWSESTLTHNSSLSLTFGLPKHADLPISSIANFVSIDVTDWVQAWLAGTLANQGFVIETSTTSATLNLYFDSKESALTSHEPQLDITLVGPAGAQGPAGPQGIQGLTGPTGPAGATGPAGPIGPVGTQGVVGPQGPQGTAGTNGNKWYSWTGVPSQALGALGDYYLNVVTGDVWQKVSNEGGPEWAIAGNIRGPQGVAGIAGPQGPAGPQGNPGLTGPQGPAGSTGLTGASGPIGATGTAGAQGPAGATGPTGATGLNWKGAWSSSTAYVLNDAVFSGGSAYMALQANTNVQPPAAGTWDLVAQRGDAGADGAQGPAGPAGSQGLAGAQGPEGPAGPMGPPGLDGQTGQPGEAGPIGPLGEPGPQGEPGQVGEQGVPGAAIAIRYAYSTDTTNSNPGAGLVRFNAAICGNATEIYVSYIDADANAWPAVLSSLADSSSTTKGQLRFINLTNTHGTPVLFNLISVSEAPGYHILGVTPVTVGYGPFSIDGEGALLVFSRTGDKGDTGSTGPTGAQGPAGPAGLTGSSGPIGPQGSVGPGGNPGAAGPAGPQGPPGPVLTRVDAQGDLSMGEFTQGPTP